MMLSSAKRSLAGQPHGQDSSTLSGQYQHDPFQHADAIALFNPILCHLLFFAGYTVHESQHDILRDSLGFHLLA